jgi:hypothetical protein
VSTVAFWRQLDILAVVSSEHVRNIALLSSHLMLLFTGDNRRDAVGGPRRCEAACSAFSPFSRFEQPAVCCNSPSCITLAAEPASRAATDVPFEDEQANRYWLTPNGDRLGYDPNVRNVLSCSHSHGHVC